MPDPTLSAESLEGLRKALKELDNELKEIQEPVEKSDKMFKSLGDAIKTLVAVGAGPTTAILAFGEAFSGLVNKANPAVFQQFTLAVNDLMAVVGQALVPIFQTVVIPVIRMAADSLMQLAPAGAALAVALQPLVELIGDAFAVAVGILAEAIKAISPVVMAFARILNDVVRFIGRQIRELLALIGINLPEFGGKPGASVGAAVRQTGHSSIEDVVKQAQRASFSYGTAANDPMGKLGDTAKEIKARADDIYKTIVDMVQHIDELPKKIGEFILQIPDLLWKLIHPDSKLSFNLDTKKEFGVDFWDAVGEASRQFGRDVRTDTWLGRQSSRPGLFGYTSINPF